LLGILVGANIIPQDALLTLSLYRFRSMAIAEIWDATNASRTGEESNAVARSLPDCQWLQLSARYPALGREEVTIALSVSTDKYTNKEINQNFGTVLLSNSLW